MLQHWITLFRSLGDARLQHFVRRTVRFDRPKIASSYWQQHRDGFSILFLVDDLFRIISLIICSLAISSVARKTFSDRRRSLSTRATVFYRLRFNESRRTVLGASEIEFSFGAAKIYHWNLLINLLLPLFHRWCSSFSGIRIPISIGCCFVFNSLALVDRWMEEALVLQRPPNQSIQFDFCHWNLPRRTIDRPKWKPRMLSTASFIIYRS